MLTLTHTIDNEETTIHFPERRDEVEGFERFLAKGDNVLCYDTETTGLDIHARGHGIRLAQFGNRSEAWVLRTDLFGDVAARALRQERYFTAHNAPYDLLVSDQHLGVRIEEVADRFFDTRVLAHLIDPRQESEGGVGLSLKPLSAVYVDPSAPDTSAGLTAVFRSLGFTKATGWANIPIDHETYVRYAGLDVILGRRLFDELRVLVRDLGLSDLSRFEHHLQTLLAIMQRRGVLLDVDYTTRLVDDLGREADRYRTVAKRYGVANVNSTGQVAEALVAMGETLTEKTDAGALKTAKEVLLPLADLDRDWKRIEAREPNPLADAVLRAKRAEKWSASYAQAFLDLRDTSDRVHPMIGSLAARTGRMSISRPPLQQLPSSDWKIRRAFLAEPGEVMLSVDYSAVEMRVLAALADEKAMKEAIASGVDLHNFTAERIYGPDFTKRQRSLAKGVGFGKVYGGGAKTLSAQTGAPIEQVREAMAAYDSTFPGIKRFGARLQRRAEYGKREVVTPSGRHLPLDRDRLYAATNYMVQSTSRDLLAQAIVDLFDKGLGDYLRLPVHDEMVASAPREDAEEVAQTIGEVMNSTFYGVPIESDPEVGGRSWGSLYGCPAEFEAAA
ncbi:DNA polymerase [Cellulosimicrobium sp. TH-20]|uniref:DNA polymerase n=1 Tax=Cellulosimicrobium sp. TH-20 TaxID=1980001 RepID=UPI0011AADEDE|nr:DNA polymerase [Cellulosimicrobium sp. TH-20]